MKKRYLILLLTFIFMLSTQICMAEIFCTQRADTDIFVYRCSMANDRWGEAIEAQRQYIEFQRAVNYKDKDNIYIHLRTHDKDFTTVKIVNEDNGNELPLAALNLQHDFYLPDNVQDKWFAFDKSAWDVLNMRTDKPQRLLCVMSGGKKEFKRTIDVKVNDLNRIIQSNYNSLQSLKSICLLNRRAYDMESDNPYYRQPYFSLYFPNQNYSSIKERLLYEVNSHKKNGKLNWGYYISQYAVDDAVKAVTVKTIDYRGRFEGRSFLYFNNNANGTLVNMVPDYDSYTLFHNEYIGQSYYHIFDVFKKVYQDLYGYRFYGFNLKNYKQYDADNFRIDEFAQLPEFDPIMQGIKAKNKFRITAINDISTENMNGLQFDTITIYANKGEAVNFTFRNEKTKDETNISITPRILLLPQQTIDYAAINAKNDAALLEKKSPLDMNFNSYRVFDIFDPTISSSEGIVFYDDAAAKAIYSKYIKEKTVEK